MNRWKILTCCVLLALAGAVVQKNREVAGLRKQARYFSMGSIPGLAGTAKPHGQREVPSESADEPWMEEPKMDPLETLSLFMPDGELSAEVIKHLGLSPDEARSLTESVRRFRVQAAEDLTQRLKLTSRQSDDAALSHFYYARARRDRGQALFDPLSLEIGSVIGQDRSRQVMKVMVRDERLARLCKMDLELEVMHPAEEGGEVMVKYHFRSPADGEAYTIGKVTMAEFEEEFDKLLEGREVE